MEKEGEGEERGVMRASWPPPHSHMQYRMSCYTYLAMFLDVLVLCWLSVQEEMFLTCSNCKSRHNIFGGFFFINPNCFSPLVGKRVSSLRYCRRGCNFVKGGSRRLWGNRNGWATGCYVSLLLLRWVVLPPVYQPQIPRPIS